MPRGKKKRLARAQPPPRIHHRDSGCDDDPKDEPFVNGLDHTAYHIAESMREITLDWNRQMFATISYEALPPYSQKLVSRPDDMIRLGRYIFKWMEWFLIRDVPFRIYGEPSVGVVSTEGALPTLIVGYEVVSASRQN